VIKLGLENAIEVAAIKKVYKSVIMTLGCDKVGLEESGSESSFQEKVNMFVNKSENQSVGSRDIRRRKKKRPEKPLKGATFLDLYKLKGETLGEGSNGRVETCKNVFTGIEYAVKIIEKTPGSFSRTKVLKEIEVYHLCRGHKNIIQLIEFFEESDCFYLVFEKINGGPLLTQIQQRVCFTEAEASSIIKDLAEAIQHLHHQGIAHRDIKPDNVLCVNTNSPFPVKLCDFDLCSPVSIEVSTPQLLTPVGSLEYMAPEVVDTFIMDDYGDDAFDDEISYNKKCDLWSLGIIMYILLCGYAPFSGSCGADCGWDNGESCTNCQELLFSNIQESEVMFPEQHWGKISTTAQSLIRQLLIKDSSIRLDAGQVLEHSWIVNGGSSNLLRTPSNLKRQLSISDLEDFASRAMAVNRAIEDEDSSNKVARTAPMDIPWKRRNLSFDLSPTNLSTRRRRSKELFSKFSSIDELDTDFFMRTIC